MPSSYAGAVAAIHQRMRDNWSTTSIVFPNTGDVNPNETPNAEWVYFEVLGSSSGLRGVGTPGSHVWLYRGYIAAHVFVPINTSDSRAQEYAAAIGEIFRAKQFYQDGNGSCVRTWSPRTDGGAQADADVGKWWRVTCVIPFEFYYRG